MYSVDFRQAVLTLYDYFQSMRKTAKAMNVSISSISRWSKDMNPKTRKRPSVKTSDALVAFIKSYVSWKPASTSIEIALQVKEEFNFPVSKQLVHLILRRIGFSFKRVRRRGKSAKKSTQ
jgi:transposase